MQVNGIVSQGQGSPRLQVKGNVSQGYNIMLQFISFVVLNYQICNLKGLSPQGYYIFMLHQFISFVVPYYRICTLKGLSPQGYNFISSHCSRGSPQSDLQLKGPYHKFNIMPQFNVLWVLHNPICNVKGPISRRLIAYYSTGGFT
jgi:hypothetical protein